MSYAKILKGLRFRVMTRTLLLMSVSLIVVSTTIYFLLATTLRKNEQRQIADFRNTYLNLFYEKKLDSHGLPKDMLFVIKDARNEILFEHYPSYIDRDDEDEEEIQQIKKDVRDLHFQDEKEGWKNILILSTDEKADFFEALEYRMRVFANEREWETILPIIDIDLYEVHLSKTDNGDWIIIGKSSEEREKRLSDIRYIALIVILPFLFIGICLSWLLAGEIIRPIKNLAKTMKEMKKGSDSLRATPTGAEDEIDDLIIEFNSLTDQKNALVKNLKDVIDNVAHDLRTPLTRLRFSAEDSLMHKEDVFSLKEALSDAVENSDQVLSLLNAIMDVTEAETGTLRLKLEKIEINQLVSSVVDLYEHIAEEKKMQIHFSSSDEAWVKGDINKLTQGIGNILDNAIKYSPDSSVVKIEMTSDNKRIFLKVKDQGIGMSSDEIPHIWKRLYRADGSRSTPGSGIGLSLVKAIVEAHGGSVQVESMLGAGSTFILTLQKCHEEERFW